MWLEYGPIVHERLILPRIEHPSPFYGLTGATARSLLDDDVREFVD
jgi:hypothetical protein